MSTLLRIEIVPIGEIDKEFLSQVRERLSEIFPYEIKIGEKIEIPKNVFNRKRRQYYSPKILSEINKTRKGEEILLGVVDIDLYVEGLNFIFGQASVKERVGIISLFRLHPEFYRKERDEELFLRRTLTEAVHELGHIFGLNHCPNPSCVMFFSNSIFDTDRKGYKFCPKCQKKL